MKSNPKTWLYGPNWQGQRCEAQTRRGTLCQRPARLPVGRCKLHGGASTGPRTEEGRARLIEARTKHGKFTKGKRSEAKRRAQVGPEIKAELRDIEQEAIFLTYLVGCGVYGTKTVTCNQ